LFVETPFDESIDQPVAFFLGAAACDALIEHRLGLVVAVVFADHRAIALLAQATLHETADLNSAILLVAALIQAVAEGRLGLVATKHVAFELAIALFAEALVHEFTGPGGTLLFTTTVHGAVSEFPLSLIAAMPFAVAWSIALIAKAMLDKIAGSTGTLLLRASVRTTGLEHALCFVLTKLTAIIRLLIALFLDASFEEPSTADDALFLTTPVITALLEGAIRMFPATVGALAARRTILVQTNRKEQVRLVGTLRLVAISGDTVLAGAVGAVGALSFAIRRFAAQVVDASFLERAGKHIAFLVGTPSIVAFLERLIGEIGAMLPTVNVQTAVVV